MHYSWQGAAFCCQVEKAARGLAGKQNYQPDRQGKESFPPKENPLVLFQSLHGVFPEYLELPLTAWCVLSRPPSEGNPG